MKRTTWLILACLSCALMFASCELSESESGGTSGSGDNGGLAVPSNLSYGMLVPYSGVGFESGDDNCNVTLDDGGVNFLHVQIRCGSGVLYEAFKGKDYVFRIVAANVEDTAEIGYWDSEDYEDNIGCWGRFVSDEFGFALGDVSMKDSRMNVEWEPVHYTREKIEDLRAQAEKKGSVGRNDEAFELGTEYYRKSDWYSKCEDLYNAADAAEVIKVINKNYKCKKYEGIVPNDALDLTKYEFDSDSKTYKRVHEPQDGCESLGNVEVTLDNSGRARIIRVSNDEGGWLAMYLEYDGEAPAAPPVPTEPEPTAPEPVDVSYVKSRINSEKFRLWDSFAAQDYSTKDSSRVGSSNTSIYIDRFENGSKVPEKVVAYRRVTQNMSNSNNGQSGEVCDGTSASKSCAIWFDSDGKVQGGAGYLGMISPLDYTDSQGYRVQNSYQLIGLGQIDYEFGDCVNELGETRHNVPLHIKESKRSEYTLSLDDDVEKWRKLWRKSSQESGVDPDMYMHDFRIFTAEPYWYYKDPRGDLYNQGPKKLCAAGDFYYEGVVTATGKAELKSKVEKFEEEKIYSSLMNGTLCKNSNVASSPKAVDSYWVTYLFYDKIDGYGCKYGSSCDNVSKIVTKVGDGTVTTWIDSRYVEITEQKALELVDKYYNGDTCCIDYFIDVVVEKTENIQMWFDEREFNAYPCNINAGLRFDMRTFCGDWKGEVPNFKVSQIAFLKKDYCLGNNGSYFTIRNWSDDYNLNISNYDYSDGWYVCKSADYGLKLAFDADSRLREVQYDSKNTSDFSWNMRINYGENVPNWFPRPHNIRDMEDFQ